MLRLFQRKMSYKKYFLYFSMLGVTKNIFRLTENYSLIFEKWFLFLKTINYFSSLSISFSN
jgi:hypothetical protein